MQLTLATMPSVWPALVNCINSNLNSTWPIETIIGFVIMGILTSTEPCDFEYYYLIIVCVIYLNI